MHPAHQCLDADHLAVVERGLRLEHQRDLAAFHRLLHRGFERLAVAQFFVHRRRERRVALARRRAGDGQGHVGVAQQRVGIEARNAGVRKADIDADDRAVRTELVGIGQPRRHQVAELRRL